MLPYPVPLEFWPAGFLLFYAEDPLSAEELPALEAEIERRGLSNGESAPLIIEVPERYMASFDAMVEGFIDRLRVPVRRGPQIERRTCHTRKQASA